MVAAAELSSTELVTCHFVLLLGCCLAADATCAVTKHNVPTPKAFNFKLSPHHAEVLQELNLAYASLANNHVLDYELQGLQETEQVHCNEHIHACPSIVPPQCLLESSAPLLKTDSANAADVVVQAVANRLLAMLAATLCA